MENNNENNFSSTSEKNAENVIQIGTPSAEEKKAPETTPASPSFSRPEPLSTPYTAPYSAPQTANTADSRQGQTAANPTAGTPNYTGASQTGAPIYRSYGAARGTPANPIPPISGRPAQEWSSPNSTGSGKKKNGFSGGFVAALLCVSIVLATAAGYLGGFVANRSDGNGTSKTTTTNAPLSTNAGDSETSSEKIENAADGTTIDAADKAANSVVVITTEVTSTNSFYGNYVTSGAGSGVIIDSENGYIITCAHVIDGASKITVKLANDEEYLATAIGEDSKTDIAVIKIEAEGLTAASIGDSSNLVVGEDVIAIGNPLGTLGGTVSDGIISALNREIKIDGQEYSLLQTSASINPGNSGGGLFDMNGNLIGVVNAKSSGTTSSGTTIEGLGFAIPINSAIEVANELISNGYVSGRVQLGIYVCDITNSDAYYKLRNSKYSALINYVTDYGVYFTEYQSGQSGDLTFGDRIVALDGSTVSSMSDVTAILDDYSVGDTVEVTVARLDNDTRRSKMVDLSITLIEYVPSADE